MEAAYDPQRMTVAPALVALGSMDPAWKDAYENALPAAAALLAKLPLVRVVVPVGRKKMETEDVLRDGKLLPTHKSPSAADKERRLAGTDSVYFHAGRTHPAYGKVALVFHPLDEEARAEVTPFGLGGLLCDKPEGNGHPQPPECVLPVSHLEESEQAAFVKDSTWTSSWRERAGHFLAAYFASDLDAYFALADSGRPRRLDPAGVFHSKTGSRDWRAWTFEVRIAGEIDLHRVLDAGRVMMWAMDEELYDELTRPSAEGPPTWFSKLQERVPRMGSPGALFNEVLREVDEEVKRACRG
jgi:hypothetical protein